MILIKSLIFTILLNGLSFSQKPLKPSINSQALSYYMQGEFLFNNGEFSSAILEFQEALDLQPNISTIHISIADAYLRIGKHLRAINHLKIAKDLEPEEVESREMLGQLYLFVREFDKAEIEFKDLSIIEENNHSYFVTLGDIYKLKNNFKKAIECYLKAYDINPFEKISIEQALQLALAQGWFDDSESIASKLIKAYPKDIEYLKTYRDITIFNKKYKKSLQIINLLEDLDVINSNSLIQKSAIYLELNDSNNALTTLINAHSLDSLNLEIMSRLFSIYLENNKMSDAENIGLKMIYTYPENPIGYLNKAILSINNLKPEEAISTLLPLKDKNSDNYTLQYLLGTAYHQLKDSENAKIYLENSLKINSRSRNTKHNLAMIYDAEGDFKNSDSLYTDLILSDSLDAQAYNNYAYSLVERNLDLDKALEMSLIANKLKPKVAPYLDTLGWIYFKIGEYDLALERIQQAYSIDESNSAILEHLADILSKTNQKQKAKLIYFQAIEIGGDSLSIWKKINN